MSNTPIIPGFYPDPSICRAGDDYYIATSSFEYVPGVPIWHSTDLVTWRQLGNALERPAQLAPSAGTASTGIFAPTLRYHDGRFWMITTDFNTVTGGHLIVSAEDPAGPWTDAVHTKGVIGIDPDLSWDEDGVCHMTWASAYPLDLQGIASVPINPETGELLGKPKLIWQGTGLAYTEAPHLFRLDGWWYLLLAEGGTERGHTVTIARARTLDGDWEACPHNPILSHRSTADPVQNTGHADLVQLTDGSWAMVYLAVRPRGVSPMFHTNGRETFLAGIDWVDGWPSVDERRFAPTPIDSAFVDDFAGEGLHPRWVSPGASPERFVSRDGSGLLLVADSTDVASHLLACRVQDLWWSAEATLAPGEGVARFQVRMNGAHLYGLTVRNGEVEGLAQIGPASTRLPVVPTSEGEPVTVRIRARVARSSHPMLPAPEPDIVVLAVKQPGGEERILGEFDGRYLSTEVVGGYTGRVVGVEVLEGTVRLLEFRYTSDAE